MQSSRPWVLIHIVHIVTLGNKDRVGGLTSKARERKDVNMETEIYTINKGVLVEMLNM